MLYLSAFSTLILFIKLIKDDLSIVLFEAIRDNTFLATDKKSLLKSPKEADCLRLATHPSSSSISHLSEILFNIIKSSSSSSFNGF